MKRYWTGRDVARWTVKGACIAAALFFISGCGGKSGDAPADVSPNVATPADSLGTPIEIEQLIKGEAYAGQLLVQLDAVPTAVSAKSTIGTAGGDELLGKLQAVVDAHPGASLSRYSSQSPEEVDQARQNLEHLSGKHLFDWNTMYLITVSDPDDAVAILHEVQGAAVGSAYPEVRPYPSGLANTPSLNTWQGYLYAEATNGGLNAPAAWNAGITGQNVYVVDNEHGMNFDHEEFTLVKNTLDQGGNFLYQPDCAPGFADAIPNCPSWIAHGVAVAGILIARDDNHGITGFSPSAYYVHATMGGGTAGDLYSSTGGGAGSIEPGSVWLYEVQLPGKYSSGSCGDTPATEYGCVPVELWPDVFSAVQQATAYGVTVIEGAGNGTMNLNDPTLYTGSWSFAHNMATDDAGAIMVGASQGANEQKISFSNCGTRVNEFAWGQGVATTGYPYGQYAWNGTTAPVPPNSDANSYFIDNFGGTSSAAAMVGGAAVLVQSYAREQLGHRRYIMPSMMRQILTNSGVAQKDASGCNIGKQPRIDTAMAQAATFIAQARAAYPELNNDATQLTDARMTALRALGVGIICKQFDPVHSDPLCPDGQVFPTGTKISKDFDFDGDGRADIVKFENGKWSIDLSSVGTGGDNYGAWDLTLNFPLIQGKWVWPYVADMNSDGRADFVVYDKEHGKFYVALTDTNLIRNGVWHGWDWVIDYSAEWKDDLKLDPDQSNYSRPVIANYNRDGWNDIAIVCSDGKVRVDYGNGTAAALGHYEWTPQLISSALLAQAPGWAYLPVPGDFNDLGTQYFALKVPDGLPDEGRMYIIPHNGVDFVPDADWMKNAPHIFGGNDAVPVVAGFDSDVVLMLGVKETTGRWQITQDDYYNVLIEPNPSGVYGDEKCHPVVGDFDGDGLADRAVMCPDEWRIAYSDPTAFSSYRDANGVRHVPLNYDVRSFSVPGRTYPGGISYQYARQLIDLFQQMHPGVPPPIPVDMVSVMSCSPGDC